MKTTIHTLKKEYKDNQTYLNEKQKLFQNLTYHMIEKELNHNDIDIQHTAVMDYYKQCEDIDETIAFFDEKYDQQLDRLGEKEEMFDDDALVFYIVKVIEHFVDIHQIPDKNYIASDLLELIQKDHDYQDLLEKTENIMKRLIKMKHEKNQDLQNTFSPYGIDLEQFFTRVFQEFDYVEHQVSFLTKIYSLLKQLQKDNINVKIFIMPTHITLQKMLYKYNLTGKYNYIRSLIVQDFDIYDFNYPNKYTKEKINPDMIYFFDGSHATHNLSKIIISDILTDKPVLARKITKNNIEEMNNLFIQEINGENDYAF